MYKIFSSNTIEELENIVNTKLQQGWKLAGGICAVPSLAFSVGALKNLREDVVLNLEEYKYGLVYLQALIEEE